MIFKFIGTFVVLLIVNQIWLIENVGEQVIMTIFIISFILLAAVIERRYTYILFVIFKVFFNNQALTVSYLRIL